MNYDESVQNSQKVLKITKLLFGKFGLYFSKQPAKYDLLKSEIRNNLLSYENGILHIGAHYGQEAQEYNKKNLNVIWIEASEAPFAKLQENLKKFKKQKALNA
jgi:hypothetical protein